MSRLAAWYARRPVLAVYVLGRGVFRQLKRRLICQPMLRAYCSRSGRGVRTGVFPPWVMGAGELVVGDRVTFYGRFDVAFAASYGWSPRLEIGSDTVIGHDNIFTVARSITIGRHCLMATGVVISDTSGHPTDPADRLAGLPAPADKVRPVTIGDNVWIGLRAIILPGTTLGDGCVVAAGAVVRGNVPAYTIVAGNPAVPVAQLRRPAAAGAREPAAPPPTIALDASRGWGA